MKTNRVIITFASAALAALTGCEAPRAAQTPSITISSTVPNISPLPKTEVSQNKGGLEITVTPVLYKAVRADQVSIRQTEPKPGEGTGLFGMGNPGPDYVFVQEMIEPQLRSQPDRLQFAVRINNKLSRVFRGQGSVVQINVGGKLMPILGQNYAEFINSIVPPRNEAEVMIFGPTLDTMQEKCTVGIFLYDVVTATDAAGNVIEKQNYTWYFSYEPKTVQETAQASTKRHWITRREYAERMSGGQLRQRSIPRSIPTARSE